METSPSSEPSPLHYFCNQSCSVLKFSLSSVSCAVYGNFAAQSQTQLANILILWYLWIVFENYMCFKMQSFAGWGPWCSVCCWCLLVLLGIYSFSCSCIFFLFWIWVTQPFWYQSLLTPEWCFDFGRFKSIFQDIQSCILSWHTLYNWVWFQHVSTQGFWLSRNRSLVKHIMIINVYHAYPGRYFKMHEACSKCMTSINNDRVTSVTCQVIADSLENRPHCLEPTLST